MAARPADNTLSARKLICVEKTVPILMRMKTASVITARTARLIQAATAKNGRPAPTGIRPPAADTTEASVPAAVMADTADDDLILKYLRKARADLSSPGFLQLLHNRSISFPI